jgi:hypothetical protein
MNRTVAAPDFSRAAPWLGGLLLLALLAFWPSYLSVLSDQQAYTHAHALTATLWMLLLILQPLAIRQRRHALHRWLGRSSYVLAPLVILSIALLAQQRIAQASGPGYAIQTYILYLQVSLGLAFALFWSAAIAYRRVAPVHARFMLGTAITLIDPILIRLMFWVDPSPDWNYQWLTFGLTDALLLVLIWHERHLSRARWVFPTILVVLVALQLPALMGWTDAAAWQAFARAVAELGRSDA